jgi:FtsZ-binding cell division protein ZapB
MVATASPEGRMKPVNLAAQLAAVSTELTCLKLALAQAREDRDELQQERDGLRQERDAWRRVAEKLNDCALTEANERRLVG